MEKESPYRNRKVSIEKAPDIILNMARCDVCNTVVMSSSVHDFRTCPCGKLSVDGGREYIRRAIDGPFTELSVVFVDGKLRLMADLEKRKTEPLFQEEFIVGVREVWVRSVKITAPSKADAVKNLDVNEHEEVNFEFSHELPRDTWTAERVEGNT
jgi:hypothetical protein